jgi:cysteine synthase A
MEGAVERASQIVAETPGAFWVRQFDAPENPRVHEEQTARELRDALGARGVGRVAALVSAVGTGGTITGLARALAVGDGALVARVVAVEPAASATLSRGERGPSKIQGIGAGFVPANYEAHRVDAIATVTDERAFETARSLATREGLLVGPSAGAAVAIALDEARAAGKGAHVVTILCDTGERYFSLERAAAAGASVS